MPRLGILAGDFVFSHSLGRNSPTRFQYGNGDFQYVPEVQDNLLNFRNGSTPAGQSPARERPVPVAFKTYRFLR
jgi:hypothetical protein